MPVYGEAQIGEESVPFCYNEDNEKITLYLSGRSVFIPDGTDKLVGRRFGVTTGGRVLYRLDFPLESGTYDVSSGRPVPMAWMDMTQSVAYYIEDYSENTVYSAMVIRFPELDYFLPAGGMLPGQGMGAGHAGVPKKVYEFDVIYRDTTVSVSFETGVERTYDTRGVGGRIRAVSQLALHFPQTGDLEYVTGLYDGVRDFFCFICNRQNIGMRDALLLGRYPRKRLEGGKTVDGQGEVKQRFVPSQLFLEPMEDARQIGKTPHHSLYQQQLQPLLQMFLETHAGQDAPLNAGDIHRSCKYRDLIDLSQSLHTTAAFEYYVRTYLPQTNSQASEEFYQDMLQMLDKYIGEHTGKKKKKARDLRKTLKPEASLEDKILRAYDGCADWKPLAPVLDGLFETDVQELAKVANKWRNELAHEKRSYEPDEMVISAIRLVEHLDYCIILRQAGCSDEQIRCIVTDTLAR